MYIGVEIVGLILTVAVYTSTPPRSILVEYYVCIDHFLHARCLYTYYMVQVQNSYDFSSIYSPPRRTSSSLHEDIKEIKTRNTGLEAKENPRTLVVIMQQKKRKASNYSTALRR